jgi:putative membrane fusion protein
LATVCPSGADAERYLRRTALEQRLAWLTESNQSVNYHAMNVGQLSLQVDKTFSALLTAFDAGQFSRLSTAQEAFLSRSTALEAAMGGQMELTEEIAAVQGQLADLALQSPDGRAQPVNALKAGYFYSQTDGWESILTPEALKALTPEQWGQLRSEAPKATQGDMGRLVEDFTWYAVLLLSAEEARLLQTGRQYKILFPLESAREITMQVQSIHAGKDDTVAVVLSADEKDDALLCLRTAKASVAVSRYSGLEIPAKALRIQERGEGAQARRVTGVYILRGGQPVLREVQVLYQTGTRAIVAWGGQNEAQALSGDRVTIRGTVRSLSEPSAGKLLLVGQDLWITAENTKAKEAVDQSTTALVTRESRLYDEVLLSADRLDWKRRDGDLVLTGENFTYEEKRGTGLKIYDAVLVEGRIPEREQSSTSEP